MNGDHLRQRWQSPEPAAVARLDARVNAIAERLMKHEDRVQELTGILVTTFTAAGRGDLVRPQRPRHLQALKAESVGGTA